MPVYLVYDHPDTGAFLPQVLDAHRRAVEAYTRKHARRQTRRRPKKEPPLPSAPRGYTAPAPSPPRLERDDPRRGGGTVRDDAQATKQPAPLASHAPRLSPRRSPPEPPRPLQRGAPPSLDNSRGVGSGAAGQYSRGTPAGASTWEGLQRLPEPTLSVPPLLMPTAMPMPSLPTPTPPMRVPIAVHVPPALLFPGSSNCSGGGLGLGSDAHPAVYYERPGLENAITANMVYLQVKRKNTSGAMLLRRRARTLYIKCLHADHIVAIVKTYLLPICAATPISYAAILILLF